MNTNKIFVYFLKKGADFSVLFLYRSYLKITAKFNKIRKTLQKRTIKLDLSIKLLYNVLVRT